MSSALNFILLEFIFKEYYYPVERLQQLPIKAFLRDFGILQRLASVKIEIWTERKTKMFHQRKEKDIIIVIPKLFFSHFKQYHVILSVWKYPQIPTFPASYDSKNGQGDWKKSNFHSAYRERLGIEVFYYFSHWRVFQLNFNFQVN